jgi:hypothetical protein
MTRSRRFGIVVVALFIGSAAMILLLQRGSEPPRVAGAAIGGELIWPYCAPDVAPPAYDSLPDAALEMGRLFEPVAAAIVPLNTLPDEVNEVHEAGFEGIQIGWVKIGRPVFRSGAISTLGSPSDVKVAAHRALWESARSSWPSGDGLYLAIDAIWDDGTLSAAFIVDTDAHRVLSPSWGSAPFPPLDDFADAELSSRSGLSYLDLVIEWNEGAAGPGHSAVVERWRSYLADRYGLGVDWPEPGTPEYWNAAPETCRSLLDAPSAVLEQLTPLRIEIEVPEAILGATDAVICIRLDGVGSSGCSALDATGTRVVTMSAWTDGVGLLRVQLARSENEATSWVDRVDLAVIDPAFLLRERGARVTIASTVDGTTFDQIARSVERGDPATVGPLGN